MAPSSHHAAMRSAAITWLVLIAATLVAWTLGHSAAEGHGPATLAKCGVIITAFLKVWLVGFRFMELHGAPRLLRHTFDAWVVSICAILMIIVAG